MDSVLEIREEESGEEESLELNLEIDEKELRTSENKVLAKSELDNDDHCASIPHFEHDSERSNFMNDE